MATTLTIATRATFKINPHPISFIRKKDPKTADLLQQLVDAGNQSVQNGVDFSAQIAAILVIISKLGTVTKVTSSDPNNTGITFIITNPTTIPDIQPVILGDFNVPLGDINAGVNFNIPTGNINLTGNLNMTGDINMFGDISVSAGDIHCSGEIDVSGNINGSSNLNLSSGDVNCVNVVAASDISASGLITGDIAPSLVLVGGINSTFNSSSTTTMSFFNGILVSNA